ncbi:conserved hypothetical protein [Trichinella spiralis]|uniref:tRNA-dihydrouridine(47) synthase [NAD(P)(+)] n=2 Tax=Trichinella spiralis TaxID=6334 RepID=E5SLN3_TRISP|nr:conserved hypothetical protein [Trichinella spiralis]KRY32399.1 tRNA-dihydrouridine(47) synthase [NAD(P)(+)]-like [Trichinella spiralis]
MDSSGVAPLKAEYIVAKKEKDGDNAQENFQEKRKGLNRKRQFYTVDDKKQLCPNILENIECKFGENCRYAHDKAAHWDNKLPDISDNCPLFEELGFCKFGLNCRFAKGHTNLENLENIVKDSNGEMIKEWRFDEQNQISRKQKKEIRNLAHRLSSEYGNVRFESDFDKERCRKKIDWSGKLCLAPLTTLGNLPFRRLCVEFGAEVTCSEMVLSTSLFQGTVLKKSFSDKFTCKKVLNSIGLQSEWARLVRHESEKCFGIQICVNKPAQAWTVTKIIKKFAEFDFLDINAACPLDDICRAGGGANLLVRPKKLKEVVQSTKAALGDVPLTLKLRTDSNVVHQFLPDVYSWGVDRVVLHGRSRNQRYINKSDWHYIDQCASVSPVPLYGIGDVLSYEDYYQHLNCGKVQGVAVARGALIKPWIFTEIIQQRHWDIRSSERLEILKKFVKYGLLHWGSDSTGVNCTRRFLLEWLSFLCRYIPVGLLEYLPQKMNDRPPAYFGRDDLETLMASGKVSDWIKISEMLQLKKAEQFIVEGMLKMRNGVLNNFLNIALENLLVLDFEATCDQPIQIEPQEIIEFPCVNFSLKEDRIVSQFHSYVRPEVHPNLSSFCTNLTGIVQDMVNNQPTLTEVLTQFDGWLAEQQLLTDEQRDKWTMVTCGSWDLNYQLRNQCKWMGHPVPLYFKSWINIKKIACNATGNYPKSLIAMMQSLGVEHEGRLHSGIDDVKNIVRTVQELKRRKQPFYVTDSYR